MSDGQNKNVSEAKGGSDDWKHRAPYKVHENDKNFNVRYEGGCHCGRVKYQLSRSCFQWAAIFHKEDINFTHGHHDLGWYDSSEKTTKHKLPCKVSCAYCRTPIMDEGRNMILLFPSLIKFESKEDRDKFAPTCHMFYPMRQLDIPDGKPKWTGIDSKSDLCEDSPPDLKRKREEEKKNEENETEGKGEE
ncbi:hypothetical protein MMC17_003854 [Xylographa soralifera]|nr:hypothetical protein [Xylographa soralifera]